MYILAAVLCISYLPKTAGVAGYFNALDKLSQAFVHSNYNDNSNEKDIFYVNIPKTTADVVWYKTVLAHEFQHMISFDIRHAKGMESETIWLNEGMSELAVYVAGWNNTRNMRIGQYLTDPVSLTCWGTEDKPATGLWYAGVHMFLRYIYEQYGEAAITKLENSKLRGISNIEAITKTDFNTLFKNWSAALYLSDSGLTKDAKYQFKTLKLRDTTLDPNMKGLQTNPNHLTIGSNYTVTAFPYTPLMVQFDGVTPAAGFDMTGAVSDGTIIGVQKNHK